MHTKLKEIATTDIKPLQQDVNIAEALKYMQTYKISSVTVIDADNHPIGIFTESDAIRLVAEKSTKDKAISTVMTKNPFYVQEDTYIHDGYILMEQKGFRHLIVVNNENRYSGIVSEGDFLRNLGFEEITASKTVLDYMNDSIILIDSTASILKIATLMHERKCEYAIVSEDNVPTNVITERDMTYFCSQAEELETKNISDIKQHKLYKITHHTSIQKASNMMKRHGVHQLLVVDSDENFIGIVTRHDLLKALHGTYFDILVKTIEYKTQKLDMDFWDFIYFIFIFW